ncbi:MAG: hypothetical protein SOX26_14365 [Phocaeicola sp.]|nr:hypothetical protein [Phocaeicola sp.]
MKFKQVVPTVRISCDAGTTCLMLRKLIGWLASYPDTRQVSADRSYNHADKSGQLPKTEPLRLRCSSLQRL